MYLLRNEYDDEDGSLLVRYAVTCQAHGMHRVSLPERASHFAEREEAERLAARLDGVWRVEAV